MYLLWWLCIPAIGRNDYDGEGKDLKVTAQLSMDFRYGEGMLLLRGFACFVVDEPVPSTSGNWGCGNGRVHQIVAVQKVAAGAWYFALHARGNSELG